MTPLLRKESLNPPPELVEVPPSMEKGWRVGEDNVIGGGEANDMGKQGSRSFAHADLVWVVVGVDVPPIIGRGWEGMASSAGLGARDTLRRPGRRRGRLRRRAV